MSIKIVDIHKHSLAASTPLRTGDLINFIDDDEIKDILDLMFFSQKDCFTIKYSDTNNTNLECTIHNDFSKPLGIETELPRCKNCVNNCIFCFIDQMPKGLRPSLYVKDDDYLYSFFYGNFITLTNLTKQDINKIISQHISPLYVSIHTTNPTLHKKMLRYKHNFEIMETLKALQDAEIELHTQIVLVPGYNDQAELFKTLADLVEMENINSIGIVPVGLTKQRQDLNKLRKFTKEEAYEIIKNVEVMKNMRKITHIYCADELFVLAEQPIPSDLWYNDYEQIENGIGLIRKLWENWKNIKKKFYRFINSLEGEPLFVTSVSGIQALNPILNEIQKNFPQKAISAYVVKNEFFGNDVTVTGLLTWKDIKNQIQIKPNNYLVLSSAMFNYESLTLDNHHIDDIKKEINIPIIVIDELFNDWQIY
jgi:putative radical SAM enzyme (TIGR03279 family)